MMIISEKNIYFVYSFIYYLGKKNINPWQLYTIDEMKITIEIEIFDEFQIWFKKIGLLFSFAWLVKKAFVCW